MLGGVCAEKLAPDSSGTEEMEVCYIGNGIVIREIRCLGGGDALAYLI